MNTIIVIIFRTFSLLKNLLLNSEQKTNELDNLLVPLLNKQYGNSANDVAKLLRQMRNKIGHGDFMGFYTKSELFAKKYMINFFFDYTEYSRQNWITIHLCCLLELQNYMINLNFVFETPSASSPSVSNTN